MVSQKKQLKVTLKKSVISAQPSHKQTVKALGLRKIRHSVMLQDDPCIRGMIKKVDYLLSVEEV